MKLTPTSTIAQLRDAIYRRCGVVHYSRGYRSRKLRKVCSESIGLDLRRKADVVTLAQRLGLLDRTVIYLDFGAKAA